MCQFGTSLLLAINRPILQDICFLLFFLRHISRLSEAGYVNMSRKVGIPTEVRIRREVGDTEEMVTRPVMTMKGWIE